MKKYLFGLFMALFLTVGFEVNSTPLAPLEGGVASKELSIGTVELKAVSFEAMASLEVYRNLGYQLPSLATLEEALVLKVPVYSVSLPDENKIVLVRDPKGFHEQALKHKMEYIAIKPTLKSEYWEFVPVFSLEKSVSFNPKTSVENASEEEMELLRIVPVADFIRYN